MFRTLGAVFLVCLGALSLACSSSSDGVGGGGGSGAGTSSATSSSASSGGALPSCAVAPSWNEVAIPTPLGGSMRGHLASIGGTIFSASVGVPDPDGVMWDETGVLRLPAGSSTLSIVDPGSPSSVVADSSGRVFATEWSPDGAVVTDVRLSVDGGDHWSTVFELPGGGTLAVGGDAIFLLGVQGSQGARDVYRSTDGGLAFTVVFHGSVSALAPTDDGGAFVFAPTPRSGGAGSLWRIPAGSGVAEVVNTQLKSVTSLAVAGDRLYAFGRPGLAWQLQASDDGGGSFTQLGPLYASIDSEDSCGGDPVTRSIDLAPTGVIVARPDVTVVVVEILDEDDCGIPMALRQSFDSGMTWSWFPSITSGLGTTSSALSLGDDGTVLFNLEGGGYWSLPPCQ